MIEEQKLATDVSNLMLFVMVFEANMVDNPKEWWIDTRTTRHVRLNRNIFFSYVQINEREL